MRVRPEVLAAVEHLAAAELRSVNAQVEMLCARRSRARRVASAGQRFSFGGTSVPVSVLRLCDRLGGRG
jgi:hypothetical protein